MRRIAAVAADAADESVRLVQDAEALLDDAGGKVSNLTTKLIAQAARTGNRLAKIELAGTCRVLGWAIAQMITLLCPRRVVIGGGVSLRNDSSAISRLLGPGAGRRSTSTSRLVSYQSGRVHGTLRRHGLRACR